MSSRSRHDVLMSENVGSVYVVDGSVAVEGGACAIVSAWVGGMDALGGRAARVVGLDDRAEETCGVAEVM